MQNQTINPANGQLLNQYSMQSTEACLQQVQASHDAFLAWRALSIQERVQFVKNIIDVLTQEKQSCAELVTQEMGKPIQFALAEIEKCQLGCHYYCENAEKFLAPEVVVSEYKASYVSYQPLGVVFAVMPWNFPFWQVFRFMIPCLLAGNVVLLKHASVVSGCGQMIEKILLQAGLPPHVFKHLLITVPQVAEVIAHPLVRGISLTGGESAGKEIASIAGQHLKKVVMELGGNDACIVLKDGDLKLAAKSIVSSRLRNTGQVCVATKRVIVEESVKQELLSLILQEIEQYPMLDPMDPSSNFGPMARDDLRIKLHHQVEAMIAQGARLLCGGYIPQGPGFYYPPTVLDQVSVHSLAYQEELFGPVLCITTVADLNEAIACANATNYGLGANIFTHDVAAAELVMRDKIDAGLCFVNMAVTSDPRFPFGGVKNSGFGRELSQQGIHEFVNIKTVLVNE